MLVMWVVVSISVKFNQKKLLAKDIHLGISTRFNPKIKFCIYMLTRKSCQDAICQQTFCTKELCVGISTF